MIGAYIESTLYNIKKKATLNTIHFKKSFLYPWCGDFHSDPERFFQEFKCLVFLTCSGARIAYWHGALLLYPLCSSQCSTPLLPAQQSVTNKLPSNRVTSSGFVRSLSVSFFIEKEPHSQPRMKRKRNRRGLKMWIRSASMPVYMFLSRPHRQPRAVLGTHTAPPPPSPFSIVHPMTKN